MKTKSIVCAIFFFAAFLSTQTATSQITVGAGLGYGTGVKSVGVNVNGQYFIMDKLAIAPDFTFFFPRGVVSGYSLKWYELNANGNYYFIDQGLAKFYGLAGINFSIVSAPSFGFEGTSSSSSKIGFNIGGGADFDIGSKITPFAQLKYTISSFDQLVISAGVRFKL